VSIRLKLSLTTALSIGLVITTVGVFLITRHVEEKIRHTITAKVEFVTKLKETSGMIENQLARVDFYIVTKDPKEIDEYETLRQKNTGMLDAMEMVPWKQNYLELSDYASSLLRNSASNPALNENNIAVTTYLSRTAGLRQAVKNYLAKEVANLDQFEKDSQLRLSEIQHYVVVLGIAGILIFIVFNILTVRSLTKPLYILQKALEKFGKTYIPEPVKLTTKDELGQLAQAFNHMTARLKELDQMKQEFTATVTHELRSPITACQSFANVMLDDLKNFQPGQARSTADIERWRTYLLRLIDNMEGLHRFISDLLEVSKIEQGKLDCQFKEESPVPILESTIDFFKPKAAQKDIHLQSHLPMKLPKCLIDSERIRQVLINLIDNAIKFTPRGGGVQVGARQDGEFVTVFVKDTGPGIPLPQRQIIFEKFAQIREHYKHAEGARGTGLGLTISKAIIELHGGKIWMEPQADRGSIFYFNVKTALQSQTPKAQEVTTHA